jgi:hypothetical protein
MENTNTNGKARTQFIPCHTQSIKFGVPADDGDVQCQSLCRDHAVPRVAVFSWKSARTQSIFRRDGQQLVSGTHNQVDKVSL